MTPEIRELKKNVDKVKMKINQLQKASFDQQISIDLYYEISELLRRILVNYCIAELNENAYNIFIIDIEYAIGSLKEKDERFNSTFNKRTITGDIINEYKDDTYIIIEPEVSIFINQSHNKELDKHLETSIINFFRNRLSIIKEINDKEDSLRIINPN